MVRIAEDVRRRREAEESGRRQAEAILRQREDVLYQELMQVHQGTVESYLQGIVVNTIDTTSSLQAYEEAKLKAQTLNNFLDRIEERRNKPKGKEVLPIVRNLLNCSAALLLLHLCTCVLYSICGVHLLLNHGESRWLKGFL